jgi:hypothetical protein
LRMAVAKLCNFVLGVMVCVSAGVLRVDGMGWCSII